ncbi:hypothetical protein [Ekhidna sp.]
MIDFEINNLILNQVLRVALILINVSLFAQTPPSPNSMGLVRQSSTPVNLYAGVPQIGVPLYSLPHHNDHSIQVGLSYHAGGHKVQDVAGPIGLGWNLSAGGKITRVVRGLPDNGNTILYPNTTQEYKDVANGIKDSEYDIYYFSFPGGGGQFIYSPTYNQGYTIPSSNLEIKFETIGYPQPDGSYNVEDVWIITDEGGNEYHFGNVGTVKNANEITISNGMEDGEYKPENEKAYVSTWNLAKIDYYNSSHDVDFSYVSGSSYSYEYFNAAAQINWNDPSDQWEAEQRNTKITISQPSYISSISTLKGTIQFSWSSSRLDIGNRYLTGIAVKEPGNSIVMSLDFEHEYFDSRNSIMFASSDIPNDVPDGGKAYTLTNWTGLSDGRNRYRLALRKINKNGYLYRSFEYSSDIDEPTNANGEEVNYYSLPPRDGYNFDYLGFANAPRRRLSDPLITAPGAARALRDERFPFIRGRATAYNGAVYHNAAIVTGVERDPSETTSMANTLNAINYPNGGKTIYNYESNKDNSGNSIGGIRVSSIVSDYGGKETTTTYNYFDPKLTAKKVYGMTMYASKQITSIDCNGSGGGIFNNGDCSVTYSDADIIRLTQGIGEYEFGSSFVNSTNLGYVFDLSGGHLGYSKVEVTRNGYGKEEYVFYNPSDNPDVAPETEIVGSNDFVISGGYQGPPYTPVTTRFFERGMIKSYANYKLLPNSSYQKQSEISYDFYTSEDVFPIYNFPSHKVFFTSTISGYTKPGGFWGTLESFLFGSGQPVPIIDEVFIVGKYLNYLVPIKQKRITAKYYHSNEINYAQSVEVFNYNSTNSLYPSSVVQTNSDGTQSKTERKYVFDVAPMNQPSSPSSEVDALWKMRQDNLLGYPVETINLFKETSTWNILSGQYTEYDKYTTPSSARPFKTYGFTATSPILESNFNEASSSGNNITKDSRYEPLSELMYDNDGAISRSYDLISGQYTDYEYDARGYLNKVEYDPLNDPNRKTTYTTKPLVGIESETDMNNKSVSYEYDSRNRLSLTRDEDSNIVGRYRYNYANENNELTGTIQINGSNLLGSTQNIRVVGLNAYGPTEIKWFDSNGNLLSTNSSFNYSFSGTGSKSVRLVLLNPEYEPKTIYGSKTFYNEWSLNSVLGDGTICSDGDVIQPIDGGNQTLSDEFYSISVNSGGTTCGVLSGSYSYQWQHNKYGGWVNFGGNSSIVELPTTLRTIGSFGIRVRVSSNCGLKTSGVKTIDVEYCPDGDDGDNGGGGTGSGSWSVSMNPTYDEICYNGSPSSASFQANVNGTFSCSGLNYTYSWSLKYGSGSYSPLLGGGSQKTVTRSMLQNLNSSIYGNYTLRVQVTDNCSSGSATKTSTSTIVVPLDCSSGIE